MTTTPRLRRSLVALAALALPLAACGGGGEPETAAPSTTSAALATSTSTTEVPAPERLDLVARDFDWDGLPDRLAAGTYPVTMRNEGTELHEISVFRNLHGLRLDELFELGPAGILEQVDMAGTIYAGAGETSEAVLELAPGTYEVVCFIPSTADDRPHFEHGMHRTLEVVDP